MKETDSFPKIDVGDLVLCRGRQNIGLVVEKRSGNFGMSSSMHVKHLLSNYASVYYVFFSDVGRQGPFYASDITLKFS